MANRQIHIKLSRLFCLQFSCYKKFLYVFTSHLWTTEVIILIYIYICLYISLHFTWTVLLFFFLITHYLSVTYCMLHFSDTCTKEESRRGDRLCIGDYWFALSPSLQGQIVCLFNVVWIGQLSLDPTSSTLLWATCYSQGNPHWSKQGTGGWWEVERQGRTVCHSVWQVSDKTFKKWDINLTKPSKALCLN